MRSQKSKGRRLRNAVIVAALLTILGIVGAVGYLVRIQGAAAPSLRTLSRAGYSLSFPDSWSLQLSPSKSTDVVVLVRDPHPSSGFDPGLVVRRTAADPQPLADALTPLLMANRFAFPGLTVVRQGAVTIRGAKEALVVVSDVEIKGSRERVLDILARTPSDVAYHLQSIAPPNLLTDPTVDAMLAGFAVS